MQKRINIASIPPGRKIILVFLAWIAAAWPAKPISRSDMVEQAALEPLPADSLSGAREITFADFLKAVADDNLDYAAQRYNVSIAEASVSAARAFQNPNLQLSGNRDITFSGSERMPTTMGASLSQTLELGGKRKYRILSARRQALAAAANLDAFMRGLRLDAAAAFVDALALSRQAMQKSQSAAYLDSLLQVQNERFRTGVISRADLLQTRVEAQQFRNELLAARADAENASLALSGFLARGFGAVRLVPKGDLEIAQRTFQLSDLLNEALKNRADLVALRSARDAAQSNLSLERANRIPDVEVGAGWTRSTQSENSIAQSPQFDQAGLSLSLPLPLWNWNRAAIASARFSAAQAQKQLEAAELKAEVQIRQALGAYRNAAERLSHYQKGILEDADAVLEAKRFSYQRGQTPLIELLDAQRTATEVRSGYNQALADHAKALIELERAAQLWDIRF